MSKGYRSRVRILYDILKQVDLLETEEGVARPTKIMYKANLSYERLRIYLAELERRGLIDRSGDGYILTREGSKFLVELERIINLLRAFGFEP